MKKVITGTLITAMMSNNVAYASEIINNQSIEVNENVDITQSTEDVAEVEVNDTLEDVTQPKENVQDSNENEELLQDNESENVVQATSESINVSSVATANTTVNRTEENVTDFNELKNAVSKSNVIINIKNDITFDEAINITGQNITINGNGRKFDLKQTDDTNRFVIKGNADNIEINNLTFDNYYTTGIYISAKNINLKDITLTGKSIEPSKAGNAKAGIDISDANTTVALENITSENHLQSGIRVKKGSHITIKGTHIHENDAVDLQSVLDNGVNTNVIDFDNDQYIEYSKNDKQVNYRSKTLNASSFESLKKAVTQSDSVINLKENIKLTETLNITGKNITINGNGKQLDLNNTENKIVIKSTANGTELNNIDIINYNKIGLAVDSAKDVTLDELKLIGTAKKSTVGIDLSAATVKIKNITSENHRESGIRLRNESNVTFEGRNIHKNDTQAIKNVVLNDKNESTMTGATDQYLQTSNGSQEIYYGFFETKEVNTVDDLKTAVAQSNRIINLNQDITLTEDLEILGQNVIINGNNRTITLAEGKKITIKSTGTGSKISDLKLTGYTSQGLLVYNAKNITLENIELIGNNPKSAVGLDITLKSTVKIQNITSSNHTQCGIRVRNGAEVEFLGGNKHTNDVDDFISLVETGNDKNTIIDTADQYDKTDVKTDANGNVREYYSIRKVENVTTFDDLKKAVELKNVVITIGANITFTDHLDITKNNVTINGNGYTFDLADTYNFNIKAKNTTLENVKVTNYKTNGISIVSATDAILKKVEVTGKDINLSNDERSKVAIDINKSTVKLDEITSSNNLYRGIQVRGESTVEILSKNVHTNDTVHMQTIKYNGENDSTIIDNQGLYVHGTEKNNNGKTTVDYFSRVDVDINTAEDFINNITNSGNVLHVNKEIKFEQSDLANLPANISELEVASNVTIEGQGNVIDLNKLLGITLKGNDIVLKNLTVRNSEDIGINIYNSRDILLDNVTVENSTRYGILVNGSTVKLKNCSTKANDGGGIMITRSRTLKADSHIDSVVEVIDSITQEESNINVGVTNLEMLDGHFQDNKFIAPDGIYNKYENDMDEKVLSEYYLDLFKIEGDARNKKYKEQTIDYMIIQQVIDVTKNTEVKNPNGTYVTLVGDGVTDNTENLKKFIEYAASHGRELYFPAGVYKISDDIDLSTINLPALSNFTLSGDKDGLAILDGSSNKEKMLKIQDAEYKSPMNYVNINNLTFNNIGLEFNGPYKKGITLNNNMFMNGQYTRQKNVQVR